MRPTPIGWHCKPRASSGLSEPSRQPADRRPTCRDHNPRTPAKPVPIEAKPDIAALAERFAQADAGMWAAAHALAKGVEPEPAASPEPVKLKVYEPEPKPEVLKEVELPEFDAALLAKMFANLAAHSMTLQDLASYVLAEPLVGRGRLCTK